MITARFLFVTAVSTYDPWEYKSMALRLMRFVSRALVLPRIVNHISVSEMFQRDGLGGHGETPGHIQN